MVASSVMKFELHEYAALRRPLIETQLDHFLQSQMPESLWNAMRYSALDGGKRFRALLCIAAAEAVQSVSHVQVSPIDAVMPCACAIEMVHAMSLIHDDLPCMDNDDFRRGKPTNHKQFGEAMALLAGDALLIYATEVLIRRSSKEIDPALLLDVVAELARALGPEGMVGGQVADSIATGLVSAQEDAIGTATVVSAELLESIHKRKTGALLRFSAWSGARLMGAPKNIVTSLSEFGEIVGLAFQIADDLLDMTGDLKTLGKTPGKDAATGKLTWVAVYGEEGSRFALAQLVEKANALLKSTKLPEASIAPLSALLDFAISRKN